MKLLWLQRRGATEHRTAATDDLFSQMLIFPRFWQHFSSTSRRGILMLRPSTFKGARTPKVTDLFGELPCFRKPEPVKISEKNVEDFDNFII